jgi:glycosyltransferase involved in cell wall biosynthesis
MYYRIRLPLEELARHDGFEVTLSDTGEADGRRSPVTAGMLKGYDAIVGQRLNKHEGLSVWRSARTPYSRLIYEIDDNCYVVNTENWQAHALFAREDVQDAVTHHAEVADLITVTNDYLADVMTKATGNRNVAVLPNHVPGWALDIRRPARSRPSVGWQGGASHGSDIGVAAEPVRRFLKRFPGWDLQLVGTDYRPTFRAPPGRMSLVKWVRVNDDPRGYFGTMNFDIGLAPLLDNEFNRAKSFLKSLEYNALGIPVLASDVEPYRGYVRDGVNGFLIPFDNHSWLDRLSELASDDALRERMSRQARECAREWVIDTGWERWAQAYSSLF